MKKRILLIPLTLLAVFLYVACSPSKLTNEDQVNTIAKDPYEVNLSTHHDYIKLHDYLNYIGYELVEDNLALDAFKAKFLWYKKDDHYLHLYVYPNTDMAHKDFISFSSSDYQDYDLKQDGHLYLANSIILYHHTLSLLEQAAIEKLCDADFMYPDQALPKSLPPEIKVINNNRLTTPILGNFNWSKYDLNENKYIDYISENDLSNLDETLPVKPFYVDHFETVEFLLPEDILKATLYRIEGDGNYTEIPLDNMSFEYGMSQLVDIYCLKLKMVKGEVEYGFLLSPLNTYREASNVRYGDYVYSVYHNDELIVGYKAEELGNFKFGDIVVKEHNNQNHFYANDHLTPENYDLLEAYYSFDIPRLTTLDYRPFEAFRAYGSRTYEDTASFVSQLEVNGLQYFRYADPLKMINAWSFHLNHGDYQYSINVYIDQDEQLYPDSDLSYRESEVLEQGILGVSIRKFDDHNELAIDTLPDEIVDLLEVMKSVVRQLTPSFDDVKIEVDLEELI